MKGVHTKPLSSHLVLSPFVQAMAHLNKWQRLLPLQSTSAAVMDQGALGGRYRHCLCFGFVEMLEQEAKAKPFYNVVNNYGC